MHIELRASVSTEVDGRKVVLPRGAKVNYERRTRDGLWVHVLWFERDGLVRGIEIKAPIGEVPEWL